jgi:hypothetical protein
MRDRWDGDARRYGVGDASAFATGAEELVAAMREPNWVAEDPEAHLLPHLEAACRRTGSAVVLERARVEDDGSLVLELRWEGERGDRGGARSAAYAVLGSVAESASYVREAREGDTASYDVVTGVPAPETPFAQHGHVLRLRIVGVD